MYPSLSLGISDFSSHLLIVREAEKIQERVEKLAHDFGAELLDDIDIIADALKINVEKAKNPLDNKDFLSLEKKAVNKLKKHHKSVSKDVLKELKEAIHSVNVDSPESITSFVDESARILDSLPDTIAGELSKTVLSTTEDMYKLTRKNQINKMLDIGNLERGHKLNPFGARDEQVVNMLNKNSQFFIKEGIQAQISSFQSKIHNVLEVGLKDGLSRKAITKNLMKSMGQTVNNPHYWDIVGSSYVNRSRNWANLETFSDVGFEDYQILAIIDERTSDICKGLNGKRFSIKKQVKILEKASEAENLKDFTSQIPWLSTRKTENGDIDIGVKRPRSFKSVATLGADGIGSLSGPREKLQKLGFALPPFHGLCRTTVTEA